MSLFQSIQSQTTIHQQTLSTQNDDLVHFIDCLYSHKLGVLVPQMIRTVTVCIKLKLCLHTLDSNYFFPYKQSKSLPKTVVLVQHLYAFMYLNKAIKSESKSIM